MFFLVETMGRSAGWLAYGAAIAGEASLVISVEDLVGDFETTETVTDPKTKMSSTRRIMNLTAIVDLIVDVMIARETDGKEFGVIVLAEGLAQFMPAKYLEGVAFDDHGNISLSQTELFRNMTRLVEAEYEKRQGKKRRVTGLQLGYEARCALPHAFDVILGSQLGVGACRALVENHADGVLISVSGQLTLNYVPFDALIEPATLLTYMRLIQPGSDFQRLARSLENYPHD
jgi:6-phosphofructokinase